MNTLMPASDPSTAQIVERIASSIYKQGEQARDAGELDVAVKHFLRVGQAAPTSPIRATAEYDAAAADPDRATGLARPACSRISAAISRSTRSRPT